jgi:hypothetical protein
MTGISQPHMHNVLKGVRTLSPELADRIMAETGLTVYDLLPPREPDRAAGEGAPAAALTSRAILFPPEIIRSIIDPGVEYLDADTRMEPEIRKGDFVLFDRDDRWRRNPRRQEAYLVSYDGAIQVRYVRRAGERLYFAAEDTLRNPLAWDFVSLADRNILDVVRGRIVWIGRQVASVPAEPAEEAGGDDRSPQRKR